MDTESDSGRAQSGAQFLPMILGIAAAVIILAGVHGASQLISQFLMAFVIVVAVARDMLRGLSKYGEQVQYRPAVQPFGRQQDIV